MKRTFYNLTKLGLTVLAISLLSASCDFLLPKKISEDILEDEEYYEESDSEDTDEEEMMEIENLPDIEENDVSSLYAEHDLALMAVYEFYYEHCFGNGQYHPERFLSKKLKKVLNGIKNIERKTGYLILDYDPFVRAQDIVFGENDYTIKRNGSSDWFTFSYGNTHVQLHLIEENGEYVIDDIMLPGGMTITKLYEEEKEAAM